MIYGRRYWKEYAIWFAVFLATMVGIHRALHWFASDSPVCIVFVVLPLLAMAGGFWVELRNLRRLGARHDVTQPVRTASIAERVGVVAS